MTNIMSDRARRLRREKTSAECMLWRKLLELNRQGFHFRQQAPIGPYIPDFADHAAKLVVELDGGQQAETKKIAADTRRTNWLASHGYKELRFWNCDVLTNVDDVMTAILLEVGFLAEGAPASPPPSWGRPGGGEPQPQPFCAPPTPNPSPQAGGGPREGAP